MAIDFLSANEIYEVVYGLYSTKIGKIKEREYWENTLKEKVYPKYSPAEMLSKIIEFAEKEIPGFKISVEESKVYEVLSEYFCGHEMFEKRGYSLKKGIFLYGNIGCGKTTAMNLFRRNQHTSYKIDSCREIAYEYSKSGQEGIEKFFKNINTTNKDIFFGQETIGRCFDDLGVENISTNFGNKSNVMAEIFLGRYDKAQRSGMYNFTHATSNLTAEQIKETYGDRVISRMKEMFNFIEFPVNAKDKRS